MNAHQVGTHHNTDHHLKTHRHTVVIAMLLHHHLNGEHYHHPNGEHHHHPNGEHPLVDHKIAAILKKLGLAKDEVKHHKEALLVAQNYYSMIEFDGIL